MLKINGSNIGQIKINGFNIRLAKINNEVIFGYESHTLTYSSYTYKFTASENSKYSIKYANGNTILEEYGSIAEITGKNGTYNSLISLNTVPANATKVVLTQGNVIKASINLPSDFEKITGTPMYSVGLISDTHIDGDGTDTADSINDLKKALTLFKNENVSFIAHCGDVTEDNRTSDYTAFSNAIADNTIPLKTIAGNHDSYSKLEQITGNSLYYEYIVNDDVYLFLGAYKTTNRVDPFSDEELSWLETKLSSYANKRVFLFFHYYCSPVGNANNLDNDSLAKTGQALTFRNLMTAYKDNIVYFSGHSHLTYKMQELISTANVSLATDTMPIRVHIPSNGRPRILSNGTITHDYVGSECAIMDVYSNYIVIKGYDLSSNKIMPIAMYKIPFGTGTTTYPEPTINIDKIEGLSEDIVRGVDVSSVISLEQSGVKFYDFNGNECDIFKVLKEANVNYARIKIWNNPYNSLGQGYGGGNSDLAKAITLGKRATQHGLKVLIDFHYSDFWADPAKQKAPKAWQDYSVSGKADAIYNFTKQSLQELINNGVDVGMVQVGNETGYSFCGCATWDKTGYTTVTFTEIAQLMNAGSRAIREVDPNILVVVHNTDPQNSYQWISRDYNDYGVDYDVFASSYYPNIHGSMENLTNELKYVADTYGKKVMVAETQYPYTTQDTDGFSNTLSEKTGDMLYDISIEGQAKHVRDVFQAVNNVGILGIGVFYWDASWIAVGSSWDSNVSKWGEFGSGWATTYASEYDDNADATYHGGSVVDNQAMFDSTGHPLDSLNVFRYIYTGATSSTK